MKPIALLALSLVAFGSRAWSDTPVSAGMVLQMEGSETETSMVLAGVEHEDDYAVYFFEADGKPSCGTMDGRPVGAIPLEGVWDETLRWRREGVTLACTNGPIGKCVTWGYLPWRKELRALHQACVRMVRADYCGTGVGQTRDGTPIDVWDARGINEPGNVEGMELEAEWDADGATVIHRTRFDFGMEYVRENCPDRIASGEADASDRPGSLLSNGSYP